MTPNFNLNLLLWNGRSVTRVMSQADQKNLSL
jgi:hypothetical protein